jgi:uncharacterized protein
MKKKLLILILIGIVILAGILFLLIRRSDSVPQVCFPNKCVNVEIVDTQEERARGLMFRENLSEDDGMLFIFEEAGNYPFWMKNTLIPLDMIWINSDSRVVEIETAVPCTKDPCGIYGGKELAKYVVEVNEGFAEENNINVGDVVKFS